MAEIEGSDGNTYNIPDFAMEDTQEKILAALKTQFKLNKNQLTSAKDALKATKSGDKAQLDAISKMGNDISAAIDGKGTLLGATGKAVTGLTSGFGILAGGAARLVGGFATLGVALAGAALSVTKGFGDDLKKAGLADTGAAFGDLGAELNVVIPGLMSMGYSVKDAAGAINDFRGAMTATSGKAIQGVIVEFNKLTNGGARYGRTLTENLDYLSEEIEYRSRLGFIDRQNAAQAAKDAQEMMDNQINASKLLGKSVDEIANGVKDLFTGDLDIAAQLANLGPEAEQGLRKAFNTLEGADLPKDIQSGMLKYMTDPIAMASEEARSVINDLNILPNNMGQPVIDAMENVRAAIESGDPKAIEAAQRAYTEATLALGPQIKDLSKEEKERLTVLGKSRQSLQGFLASQNTLAIAAENYANINHDQVEALNESLKNSVLFDNQITVLKNTFNVIVSTLKAGFAPALENITGILGDIANPDSPLGSFQVRLKGISESFVESLNSLLGTTGNQEEATAAAKGMLERFAGYIESAANGVLNLVQAFQNTEGDSFMERIATFFMENIIKPLGSLLADGLASLWDSIDLVDIMTGNTDGGAVNRAKDIMELEKNKLDAMRNADTIDEDEYNKRLSEAKANSAQEIFTRAQDEDYDSAETLKLLERAGLAIEDISSAQLADLFPDPKALEEAIIKSGGSQEQYTELANTISTQLQKESDQKSSLFSSGLKEELKTQSEAFANAADTEIKTPPKNEVPDTQPSVDDSQEVVKPGDTQPSVDQLQKVVDTATKIDEKPGTRPVTPSSTSVQTDPEGAEPTSASPTSQDGTKTQEVKPAITSQDSEENKNKSMEDLLLTQLNILNDIKKNTGKTASGISSLPLSLS